jgi:hypothetical protein
MTAQSSNIGSADPQDAYAVPVGLPSPCAALGAHLQRDETGQPWVCGCSPDDSRWEWLPLA